MTNFNFLSNLLSLSLGSQSSDVSLDRRLTVGSPSGRYCSGLMRLVFILAILLTVGVGNAWAVDYEYQMITAASQMTAGTYVVGALRSTTATNNFYFGKATVSSGDWVVSDSYVTVAESNGVRKFDATSLPTGAVEFTFTGNNTDGFTIANGSNYLYYTANSNRKLAFASTGSTYKWTVADKSSPLITGGVCLKKKTGGTASNYTISENATGTGAIRGYSTTTVYRGIYLFKKQEKSGGSTPSLSATPTSLDWGTVNKGAGLTTKTFTISGSNLTGNLSVATTGSYTVDCGASITVTSGSPTVTTITVTAPSTATAGTKNGTITISGGGASSVAISCSLTVNEIDQFIDEVQSTAGYTSASPHIEGGTYSTPSLTDKSVATSGTCEQQHYHFVGWITKTKYDAGTSIAVGDIQTPTSATGATYYAVWAKQAAGGSSNTITLTYSDFGYTTTTYSEKTCTKGGIGFTCNQGCRGTSPYSLQMNSSKGTGSLYNTTAITGLQSVTLKCNANNTSKTATVYQGASSNPTSTSAGTAACAASTNYTINITSGSYFTVKVGGATYFSEVVIAYSTVTYEDYIAKCCTQLGSINGSFSLSSTGTSVTATVTTAGVSAYGDADNVSGYDFNLYTASAGGSAAATYSSDSKAGTSHEFTGLTPLTQYWVTVRPIGSGSYCNTTAESDRVAIYTCPGSPNHVDVSGRWDRFGGETISLTAAAYATAGTGTAIPAAKITGYQWQKYYNSIWNDISNGGTTSGATTNNLQITNCSNENSGSYRCVVSTVAGCDIASDGFQVKVYALECYNSGTTVYNFTRTGDTQAGTVQIDLSASTNYGYKVHADNDYYGNSGTVNEDVTNWEMSTGVSNNLTVASGLGGTFTFAIDYSTGGNNSTEGIPEISVTYPRKTIFLTPGVWNTGGAKFAFYYFRKVGETIYGEGFTDFITADDCGSSAEIPLWNGVKINAVRLNSNTTASDLTNSANHYKAAWDKKWNQTGDITITSNNSISITDWGTTDSPYEYGTYAVPTYTISYATGSVPTGGGSISGSKANETKTCGVDFTLPAAQFTTTGYVQTGWSKADGGAQYAAVSGSYTDNSAQTFYPVWTANTHTLTWDKNGGDALTGDYTSGTVAYATAITAPNTPTWTGHRFDGWDNGSGVVTPATTMPDNDLSYTAQWSLAIYTVTLNVNSGTINAGNVTSYTYGTGATLPTNVTRDGYRFDGWFSDDGVWSDQVTAISTTATGDKTYYAKWTQVYTVTWSVNGETWSSGVVEGNTHVPGGSKVSALPTAPTSSDCDDSKVFVGWKAAEIDGVSVSDPGGIFTTQGTSPTINANMDFYAVFADENGGDFTRVTNVSQLSAGKKVILGYEATANSGVIIPIQSSALNGTLLYTGTTEGSAGYGTLTISSMSAGDEAIYAFTIRAGYNSGYWAFEMSGDNAGKYLGHSGRNAITNFASVQTDDKTDFSIVIGTNDVSTITNKYGAANTTAYTSSGKTTYYNYCYLSYNYNNGNPRAALYKETQTGDFVIYLCNPLTYSNYVTSCASCDADATFTNTTPAVSDIDCTSATLTATGGLATLGAAGCNISDYGFVIGTSDNPAVGGDGVTKFQVGTSNPTLGNDFSYNATGLTKGTRYYIRAYAINRHGTAYSTSTNFWTKNVSSIAITTAPTKTNYIVGETFDATGMVVTATMASGATEDVTSDVTYSSSALTAGTSQNFAINYTLCETEKSVNQVINVYTLTVNEGTNPGYGTATNSSANIVSITGLGDHKTYTVTVTSSNATAVDNGDNTWSIINATGNVTVTVDYADAVQVKVYYKVDGVTVTGLTRDVYQSETTTLPTASDLATAMTAQGMDLPDDDYPNFVGWSETEFSSQTSEPTIVSGTPAINAEKTYYAVFTNLGQIHLSADNLVGTYPSTEKTVTVGSTDFKYHYLGDANLSGTHVMQFKKHASEYGYIYNNNALSNILRIEIGYYNSDSHVPVYAASAAGTIAGGALTPASRETTDPYVYTFPASTSYFMVKGDNSSTYKISYIDIYYASSTVYYMTQFCTRYTITGASTSGTAVTGGTLTSSANSLCSGKSLTLSAAVTDGYAFGSWTVTGATSGDLTSTLLGANASSVTPPAFTMPAENITVSATITEKEVTGWTWKQELADASEITIPATVELYIGQQAKFNLKTYDPADVLAGKKGYSADYTNADLAQDNKAGAYYITRGKIAKESTTLTLTSTSNGSVQEVIIIRIKELPLVHFVDNIHGETFADVVANVDASEKRTVYTTKPTPTHSDVSDPGASYNTCERQHLHLIGWIESEWADAHPNAEPGDITGAGAGNYYAAGANIDLVAQNGKTFYAVWAKFE